MIRIRILTIAVMFALLAACTSQAQQSPKTLYQRLGGYDAIAAVSDDFIMRLGTDPQFAKFFTGFSMDSQKRLRQMIVELLCQESGGPCFYTGRSMKQSHAGLRISEDDWNKSAVHLTAALDRFRVGAQEKNEVLALAGKLKPDIVER
jgi:hemoglobin